MNTLFKVSCNPVNDLSWYTWSNFYMRELENFSDHLAQLNTTIVNLSPREKYGMSYLVEKKDIVPNSVRCLVKEMAHLIVTLRPKDGIYLLNNLTTDKFTSRALHALFSLISEEIRRTGNSHELSFHSPIEEKVKNTGFPVHADLYKMKAIFNVISYVENTNGGDVTLLSASSLNNAMDKVKTMPLNVKETINSALTHRSHDDMFDYIFDLMYGRHDWVPELTKEIEKRQFCIPAEEGIGYMLIDGMWLHGRTAISGSVVSKRLQRLVFDTEQSSAIPYLSKRKLQDINNTTKNEIRRKSKSLCVSESNDEPNNHIQWTTKSKAIRSSFPYS